MPERPLGPRTTRKAIPIVPFHPVTDAHVREVRLGAGSPNLIWRQVLDCDADALAGLCAAMKELVFVLCPADGSMLAWTCGAPDQPCPED